MKGILIGYSIAISIGLFIFYAYRLYKKDIYDIENAPSMSNYDPRNIIKIEEQSEKSLFHNYKGKAKVVNGLRGKYKDFDIILFTYAAPQTNMPVFTQTAADYRKIYVMCLKQQLPISNFVIKKRYISSKIRHAINLYEENIKEEFSSCYEIITDNTENLLEFINREGVFYLINNDADIQYENGVLMINPHIRYDEFTTTRFLDKGIEIFNNVFKNG